MPKDTKKPAQSAAGKYAKKGATPINGAMIAVGAAGLVLLIAIIALVVILVGGSNKSSSNPTTETTVETTPVTLDMEIAGVDISGLTQEEAAELLDRELAGTFATNTMKVAIGDAVVELTPEISGASFDAVAFTTDLFSLADGQSIRLSDYLNLDMMSIDGMLDQIVQNAESVLTPSTVTTTGAVPDLKEKSASASGMKLVVTIGTPGIALSLDAVHEAVMVSYDTLDFDVEFPLQRQDPELPDLNAAYEEYSIAPKDAEMDKESFAVTGHSYGYEFDVAEVENALKNAQFGQVLEFDFYYVDPEVLTEDLEETLFRDTLGTYTAVSASVPGGRDVNLQKSCEAIDGTILFPGEQFDYNTALGERTPEAGWQKADGYNGMVTEQQYGGGICQASSSLYYCCLIADLQVDVRVCHGFISSYMPYGMDATVSWGGPDFRFTNNTEYPIRIDATASGGTITVSIVGTDTKDYYVEMEYEILKIDNWETKEEKLPEDNEDGYKDGDTIISPYTGYQIQTYKCKYDKKTGTLLSREKEALSDYNRRDKVVAVIEKEEPTTEPTEAPTTAPTEEPTTEATDPVTQSTEAVTLPDETFLGGSGGGISEDG